MARLLGYCDPHAHASSDASPHYKNGDCVRWQACVPQPVPEGSRLQEMPLPIKHSALHRLKGSAFKSDCPICRDGVLTMVRDASTSKLRREDRCLRCGQEFIYTDAKVAGERLPRIRKSDS